MAGVQGRAVATGLFAPGGRKIPRMTCVQCYGLSKEGADRVTARMVLSEAAPAFWRALPLDEGDRGSLTDAAVSTVVAITPGVISRETVMTVLLAAPGRSYPSYGRLTLALGLGRTDQGAVKEVVQLLAADGLVTLTVGPRNATVVTVAEEVAATIDGDPNPDHEPVDDDPDNYLDDEDDEWEDN